MKKKGQFAKKGQKILGGEKNPSTMKEFLEEVDEDNKSQISVNPDLQTKETETMKKRKQGGARLDLRYPVEIEERLRQYCFDKRRTKTETIVKSIEKFLEEEGY